MNQFLNNIWLALSTENPGLVTLLSLPLFPVENFTLMNLFLTILNVNSTRKQKLIYVASMSILTLISLHFIPAPFNIIVNYLLLFLLVKSIFKLNILKSFVAFIVSTFVFGIFNVFMQNPYLTVLNISLEQLINIPIYRIPYLLILYILAFGICEIIKNFKKPNFSLDLLDNLDKHTIILLCINLLLGLLTLCIQLITTTFYIDIVPIIISILNFILLISFFILSIYSLTRIIKLANTKRDLQSAEEYNKSLEILYDKVKGFKHDFDNIVSTLDGFIETDDMLGLKNYFNEVKKDCKITNNLSIINPRAINNPGIYSLLNNKYFKATNAGVNLEFEYFLDLNKLDINLYEFSRILGILIDNAIEEAEKCENKIVKLSFIQENRNNRAVITIQNTYLNKDVDVNKIFDKGESGKENHSGIGLWEVRNYLKKSKNLDLFTSKNDEFFIQKLSIYKLQKK